MVLRTGRRSPRQSPGGRRLPRQPSAWWPSLGHGLTSADIDVRAADTVFFLILSSKFGPKCCVDGCIQPFDGDPQVNAVRDGVAGYRSMQLRTGQTPRLPLVHSSEAPIVRRARATPDAPNPSPLSGHSVSAADICRHPHAGLSGTIAAALVAPCGRHYAFAARCRPGTSTAQNCAASCTETRRATAHNLRCCRPTCTPTSTRGTET